LLSRKIGSGAAEKMILSGKLFRSEELFDLGIVDVLAEKGGGEIAVYNYMKTANRSSNTYSMMRKVRDICNQVDYKELQDIAMIWVDAALKLKDKDLRMMSRLVRRQNAKISS
jgi:DSF synthase